MKSRLQLHWSRLESLLLTHTTYAPNEIRCFLRRGGHRIPLDSYEQQIILEDQQENKPIAETAFRLGVKPSTIYTHRRRAVNEE